MNAEEYRKWLKKRRKMRLRILAAILCFCVFCTTYPNILETLSALASSDAGAARITEFVELPQEVQNQVVALGTKQEALILPGTLEAYIEQSETGSSSASDTKPQTTEPETTTASDTKPQTTESETEKNSETSAEPETEEKSEMPAEPETEEKSETPAEPETEENSGTSAEPETGQTSETSAEPETRSETTPEIKTESEPKTEPVQTPQPGQTPESDEKIDTYTVTLPAYEARNKITAKILRNTNGESAPEPSGQITPEPSGESAPEPTKEPIRAAIENIKWTSAPVYDKDREDTYTFTPILPSGYTTAEGAALPKITVTVAQTARQQQEKDRRALITLLTALPDPEDYITYDAAADLITDHPDIIDEAQIAEARQAADDYLNKYSPTKTNTDTTQSATTPEPNGESAPEPNPEDDETLAPLLTRLKGLEHIRDTEESCADIAGPCPYHYPQFLLDRMNQNETPAPLTLEDLIEDYGVEPTKTPAQDGRRKARAAAPTPHPQTLVVTTDNENNAHTGTPDGDMDTPMYQYKIIGYIGEVPVFYNLKKHPPHPVEVSFTLDEVPTQSAYVAIKAFGVNMSGSHFVYVNDDIYKPMDLRSEDDEPYNSETLGCLRGTSYTWNTTILEIPLKKLVKGKNVISIVIPNARIITVDWMQLILDGGTPSSNVENFSMSVTDYVRDSGKAWFEVEAEVKQKEGKRYLTEYTLMDADSKAVLGTAVGDISETERAKIPIPAGQGSGILTIDGILKDADTETIVATDSITFYYVKNVGMGVKTSHTLTPSTYTNQSVTIQVNAEQAAGAESMKNVTVTPKTRTVTQNGTYDFTIGYQLDGRQYSYTYKVKVDNIDKEPPFIGYTPVSVTESQTQQEFEKLFKEALTVTDNVTKECTVTYTLPKVEDVRANGGGQVKVTAQDALGNKSEENCLLLAASPLAFSKPTAVRAGTTKTYTLTAKLTATGGKTVTESGFVWGIMANPTITFNQGSAKTASPVTKGNVNFSVKTTEIVEGMTYYARAYAKIGTICYYSDSVRFKLDTTNYGTFTIKNNGNNTFTVTRSGGSEGAQTVYYRTLNGSAVGGTHFTHKASTLVFKEGETTKTITVTEKGVTQKYNNRTATAYSNADRTYQVELYRVTGGGSLGSTATATRTMAKDSAYTINRSIYEPTSTNVRNTSSLWDEKGSCHQFEIPDGGAGETNGRNNGINLYNGRTNHKGHKSKPFNLPRYHQTMPGTDKEKAYFKDSIGANDGWGYRYVLRQSKIETGWGHLWIGYTPAPTGKQTVSNGDGKSPLNVGNQKWAGYFDIDYENQDIVVPNGSGLNGNQTNGSIYTYGGNQYILFGTQQTAYMHFAACGSKDDMWKITSLTDYRLLADTKEPQLLGVAPMAGGTYKEGDAVTISLVFDEIVDSKNSSLSSSIIAKTSWGNFTYAGGADTNVLYFKGTVPANATKTITVSSIANADKIKDLCNNTGGTKSAGTGSTSVTVDTTKPTVQITNTSLINGTASAKITATNADTLRYTWSESTTLPAAGWFNCKSGDTVKTRQASGKWYLHALATYENTGASTYQCSSVFDFGTPENPKFPLPELTVTTDNSRWTNGNRTITVKKQPANATLKVTKPDKTTATLAANAASYTAQDNGLYTFTLTANGETVVKDITVEKIDRKNPTVTLTQTGSSESVFYTLNMAAKAADDASGVAKVEYAFTTGNAAPASGWQTAGDSDKLSDGRYRINYTATQTTRTSITLYVRATDNAGNVTTVKSETYTVMKEPTADKKPKITLTADTTAWTKGNVTLTWKLTNGGAGNCTVYTNEDKAQTGKTTGSTGTFKVQENGIYMVNAIDDNGDTATAAVIVNNIDKEAPELESLTTSTEEWANYKRIKLTGINDDLTVKYLDEKGATEKSGSGVSKREYQLSGTDTWKTFSGEYFDVYKTGTYKVRLTDNVGNESEYTIEVTKIDRTSPTMAATVNNTPNASGWYTDSTVSVTLTYEDKAGAEGPASGVQKVLYAFTTEKKVPSKLTSLNSADVAKGSAVINLTQNGTYYFYCVVYDKTHSRDYFLRLDTGEIMPIPKDQYKGSLSSLTGPTEGQSETTGLAMTAKIYYGPSGAEVTATGQTGTVATFAPHSGPSTKLGTAAYTTKTVGANYLNIRPTAWGKTYYWTYYVRRVTFDSQGGSAVPNQLVWTRQTSTSTSTAVDCKVAEPTQPTRTGYQFEGWYTDAACSAGKEFDFTNQTQVRANTTLYAKWTAIPYDVTYHLMMPGYIIHNYEGTDTPRYSSYREYTETEYDEAPDDKKTYFYGQKMELPVPKLPSNVTGFTFDGWYTNENYTGTRYTSIPETTVGDMEYYARWLDTGAPAVTRTTYWYYLDPPYANGWYRISGVGFYISDNVVIDKNSIEHQIDGGEWQKGNYTVGNPGFYYGSNWAFQTKAIEGTHTYRFRGADTSGHVATSASRTYSVDNTNPTYDKDKITYSTEPLIRYINYDSSNRGSYSISDTEKENWQKTLIFAEVPTIRIPVQDKPKEGVNATSGLWKLTYTQTKMNFHATGGPLYEPTEQEVLLTGLGEEGTAEITLPGNWCGKITNIKLYDYAGNFTTIGDIEGVVLVDTTPPVFDAPILLGKPSVSSAYNIEIDQDKWYTQDDLKYTDTSDNVERIRYLKGDVHDNYGISGYRWIINGVPYNFNVSSNSYIAWRDISSHTGVNYVTFEVTDYAGHVVSVSTVIKISGDKEQTPTAVCDYPADMIAQLAPNSRYALTVPSGGSTTYTVTTDEQGKIPFVLNAAVADELSGSSTVDLCGQNISIVRKGTLQGGDTMSADSAAQTLTINPRPTTSSADNPTIEYGIKGAGDVQIIPRSGRTWEYQNADGTWTDVPADGVIKNVRVGANYLRVKAKAQTTTPDDGYPHSNRKSVIVSNTGATITLKYDLNADGDTSANPQPTGETGLPYTKTLTRPTNPTRTGYDFIGWYHQGYGYAAGADTTWRFANEENPNIVGDILGTDRADYDKYSSHSGSVYTVTLYAKWRENVAPKLTAALRTTADGTEKDATQANWHNNLSINLTYSDNTGVTKLSVKKDSGAYMALTGNGIGNGTANTSYTLPYTDIEEGEHTYTFKAEDAAGNTKEIQVDTKLDSVKPNLGEASFGTGYKHLWDWIIKKESLTITIPITETGSGISSSGVKYTLTPTGGSAQAEQTASLAGSASGGYSATITIPKTFKGTLEVKAADNAGNKSDTMTIGAAGSGIAGVLVESSAPVIEIKADRAISDTAATAFTVADGKTVDTTNYYNSAPVLFVTARDNDLDNGQTAAGLASISWNIGGGAQNPVGADYLGAADNKPLTAHSFTIGGLEGETGTVTVTVTATDHAGNVTTQPITLHIKGKTATPAPKADYINEKLTGLTAGALYNISGEELRTDENGSIPIKEAWFGSDLSVIAKTTDAATMHDSDAAQLTLAARPDAPGITKTDESIKGKQDGKLHHLDTTMEYSTDDGATWNAVQTGSITADGVMENLSPGVVRVRKKAIANTAGADDGAPCGQEIHAQIEEGRTLTVTFDTNGGSAIPALAGLSWHGSTMQTQEPKKAGYILEGWYQEADFNNRWYFAGETGESPLEDDITLYARWTDDKAPALEAVLTDSARTAVSKNNWYNSLAVTLTYSDNEAVTALYVKKDSEAAYTPIPDTTATEDGTDADGNTRYQVLYTGLADGEHTYTFKAVDAAGKETETAVTAKLDTTKPAFGTAVYEEGHKNLWNWIIRKESLLITIPVTEQQSGMDTVAYTLTPAQDTADTITGTAKISGSQNTGYQAQISIAPDFRGTVKIKGSDKAGNTADEKSLTADGGGVIVENNAPQITILADRLPSEPDATRPDGTTLTDDAYDSAPALIIQLTDDGTGDGSTITSGIASVKYKLGDGAEQTAAKDYDIQMITQDTVTIPDTALTAALAEGATSITVTVTAADQAGNTAVEIATVYLKSRERTPNAAIGYVAETLTTLNPDAAYLLNDTALQTGTDGTIPINENWFDEEITIVLTGDHTTTKDSAAQTLAIPPRPTAPTVTAQNETYPTAEDGALVLAAQAADTAYELSTDGGGTWQTCILNGNKITGLTAGEYQIRTKAVEGKRFASLATEITVAANPPVPYEMPDAAIDYRAETLTGLTAGAKYELLYGDVTERDENDSEEEVEGWDESAGLTSVTLTADKYGALPIEEEWLGKHFYIVRAGNNKDRGDSPAQELDIPQRPATPAPTGEDVDKTNPEDLAKLKGLTADTAYDISADGGKTWETRTADANGVIMGLDAPEAYIVRVSATDASFASKPGGEVEVDNFQLTITFMVEGEVYKSIDVYYGKKLTPVPPVPPKKDAAGKPLAAEWCKDEDGNQSVDLYSIKITEDMTVYAYYSEGFEVTLGSGEGYTLTAREGSISPVKKGGSYGFIFALEDGYRKAANFAVKVNGVEVTLTAEGTYTIMDIREEKTVTIEGVEKIPMYTVTLENGEDKGYTLTAQDGSETPVLEGGSYGFTFALADGYRKAANFAVKVNGVEVTLTSDGTYVIENIAANQSVTVEGVEKIPVYTVTLESGEDKGYTLTAQDGSETPVLEGGSYGFTFALADGYRKAANFAVKVNGVEVTLTSDGTYVIENIAANQSVTVEGVEKIPAYTVTLESGEDKGYTLTAQDGSETPVLEGGSYGFTFALADGYRKAVDFAVKVNGAAVLLTSDGTYVIENIAANQSVTVEGVEKIPAYTVTLESGEDKGYTLTAQDGSETPVLEGGSYGFTFALADGYRKAANFAVKINGVEVTLTSDGTYVIENIAANQSVTVEGVEKIPAYIVTLESGEGYTLTARDGSVSPLLEGGSYGFTFALADGYRKAADFAVKVNGTAIELTADGTYTITDIRENKTVTVEGVEKTPNYYTVTLKGGTGYTLTAQDGSKSPVEESGSFGFTFALKKGYQETKNFAVKVNGTAVELTADKTYVIENITENKTVTVEGVKKKSSGGSSGGSDDSGDSSGGSDGGSGGGSTGGTPPTPQNPPADTQQPANPANPLNPVNPTNPPADNGQPDTPADGSEKDKDKDKDKEKDKEKDKPTNPADGNDKGKPNADNPTGDNTQTPDQKNPSAQDNTAAPTTQTIPAAIENGALVPTGDSAYDIACQQASGVGGKQKCSLCHICPTFLGICCFIWLAIMVILITIVLIIVFWRKNNTSQKR